MGKLTVIFYVFVVFVLGLFACFTFLMTTVNPAPLVTVVTAAPIVDTTTTTTTAKTTTAKTKHENRMQLLGYEAERTKTSEPPKEDEMLINEIDSKPFNDTYPKKHKGRRSIDHRRKKDPGVVIMKVVDSDGRPRFEIVFYPKRGSNDWRMYRKNNILGSKRRKTNLLRNSILNIMPDDSIVFENNWGFEKNHGDISDKIEVIKKVFDMENLDSNIIKTLNHNESVTNLNNVLLSSPFYPENYKSIENPHANITTAMKIDFVDEVQTTPNLNIVSWKIADIDINEETGQASDLIKTLTHDEEVTKEHSTVLPTQLHTAQDTSMESPHANDTTDVKMDFSEDVQKMSYKEVSVENTVHSLHSTDPSFDIVSLNKEDIEVNKYESSTHVFDMKGLRIVLATSNINEGTSTQSNTVLMPLVPETSSIEGLHANDTMKTEMDFSEETSNGNERLTELSTDSLSSAQDTSSKGADENISTETGQASDLIKILTHDEEVTKEHITVLPTQLHTAQDTSMESPHANDTTDVKMDFSEDLQKMSYKEVSVENTVHSLHSTDPSFDIVSLNKEDIEVNKYESSTHVFDMKGLRIVLATSNINEGTSTQSNTVLMLLVPETSSIEGLHANATMKTEMDFSEETSNGNERLTELSTDSLSSAQDTSSKGADENISTEMLIDNINEKEQSQQQSDNDMYINTDTLLNSTIPTITVESSNELDIWISETPTTNAFYNEAIPLSTQDTLSTGADENVSSQTAVDKIKKQRSDNNMYMNTDTLLNFTIPNNTVDNSNEPDVWKSEALTTNAFHNKARLLSTLNTSFTAAIENTSKQMTIHNINEQEKTPDNDMYT